jgi:hypothetical protein
MNHSAKKTRTDKPADAGSISDVQELGGVLRDSEIEEITEVREIVAKQMATPPPVPKIDKGLMAHMDAMEAERANTEFDTFTKVVMKGYRFNPNLGIWERGPRPPEPKIRDERDIQGT